MFSYESFLSSSTFSPLLFFKWLFFFFLNFLQKDISVSQWWSIVRTLKTEQENWPGAMSWSHGADWEVQECTPLEITKNISSNYDCSHSKGHSGKSHGCLFIFGNRVRLDDIPQCLLKHLFILNLYNELYIWSLAIVDSYFALPFSREFLLIIETIEYKTL